MEKATIKVASKGELHSFKKCEEVYQILVIRIVALGCYFYDCLATIA